MPVVLRLVSALVLCAGLMAGEAAGVGLVDDDAFLDHLTGTSHPERPARLLAIREALAPIADRLVRLPVREATREDLLLVHTPDYVHLVEREVAEGRERLSTGDTRISAGSLHAARLAVGGVLAACDAVLDGRVRRAFCAVRPPGHHATPTQGMGFCIFSNVAIAAKYLMERRGLERVLVVDLDVHAGNGTYAALKGESRAFQFHLHRLGIYPGSGVKAGSGRADETGEGVAQGNVINLPLPAEAGDEAYLDAIDRLLTPALERWRPQFVLVSAGYDAHRDDPLGGLAVTTEGHRRCFARLAALADRHCEGRLVAALEGGYDLPALGASVRATVEALDGR